MNKIVLLDNKIKLDINDDLTCEFINDEIVKKLNIYILNDTKLKLEIKKDIKLDVNIELSKNVTCNLLETKITDNSKVQVKYNLKENSVLNVTKIHDVNKIFERNIVYLKGKNSKINYVLKTISKNNEKYDLTVYHQNKNTTSNIINNGVNIEKGILDFNVTTSVPKDKKNSIVSQNNRIINLTNSPCTIRPILLIDEIDVIANHSALIGNFKNEEYFYIEKLGIDKDNAFKLLLKGFLISNSLYEKEILNIFEKHWR